MGISYIDLLLLTGIC